MTVRGHAKATETMNQQSADKNMFNFVIEWMCVAQLKHHHSFLFYFTCALLSVQMQLSDQM